MGWKRKIESSNYILYEGRAEEVLPFLPEESVDCIVIDPPYNVGYQYNSYDDAMNEDDYFDWQMDVICKCERLLRRGGSLFYLHYPEFAARMFWEIPANCDLAQVEWINWIYNAHTGGSILRKASRAWLWMSKETPLINYEALVGEYKNPTDVRVQKLIEQGKAPRDYDWWYMEQVKNVSKEKTKHPCQIPRAMIARLIDATTHSGMTVLDPFCGSGTTLEVATLRGRLGIGIEVDPLYCAIVQERLKGVNPLFENVRS
jgi:site-specific DNA-methyltransferase (adenine-specific)